MLHFMGLQRVGHDLATEQQQYHMHTVLIWRRAIFLYNEKIKISLNFNPEIFLKGPKTSFGSGKLTSHPRNTWGLHLYQHEVGLVFVHFPLTLSSFLLLVPIYTVPSQSHTCRFLEKMFQAVVVWGSTREIRK